MSRNLPPSFLNLEKLNYLWLTDLMEAVRIDREQDFYFLGRIHNIPGFLASRKLQIFAELVNR